MSAVLVRREAAACMGVLAAVFAVVAFYVVAVVYLFDPSMAQSLDDMMAAMPELFAAFGMATSSTTLVGFMLNYLQGFLLTLLPLLLVVLALNKMLVKPVSSGSLAGLLALPVSRAKLAGSLAASLAALLAALLAATTLVEVACAEALFPGDLDVWALLRANAGLLGLWLFMAGLCFASACVFSHAGLALGAGSGLCLLFYLMQMVSGVGVGAGGSVGASGGGSAGAAAAGNAGANAASGVDLSLLGEISPFSLYDAYALAAGEGEAVLGACALAAIGIMLFAIGIAAFRKRDFCV